MYKPFYNIVAVLLVPVMLAEPSTSAMRNEQGVPRQALRVMQDDLFAFGSQALASVAEGGRIPFSPRHTYQSLMSSAADEERIMGLHHTIRRNIGKVTPSSLDLAQYWVTVGLTSYPGNLILLKDQLMIHNVHRDDDSVLAIARQIVELDPKDPWARQALAHHTFHEARYYFSEGLLESAMEHITLAREHVVAWVRHATFSNRPKALRLRDDIRRLFEKIESMYQAKLKAADLYPHEAAARLQFAAEELAKLNFSDALNAALSTLEVADIAGLRSSIISKALRGLGDFDGAIAEAAKEVGRNPESHDAYYELSLAYFAAGSVNAARHADQIGRRLEHRAQLAAEGLRAA